MSLPYWNELKMLMYSIFLKVIHIMDFNYTYFGARKDIDIVINTTITNDHVRNMTYCTVCTVAVKTLLFPWSYYHHAVTLRAKK